MAVTGESTPAARPRPFDRLLGVFTEVHPGEGARAVTMLANIFLILVSYYIIKTVREPLILTTDVPGWLKALGIAGPAEVKTYAAAGQALLLMGFVPAYSAFASRVDRMKLVYGVTAFFVANILLFAFAVHAEVDHIGVFYYVWVGLFSLSIVAQFWSVRQRHLHQGRRQPALSDHRRRHDGRKPGRRVDCRADVPRAPLAAPDALPRRRAVGVDGRPVRRGQPQRGETAPGRRGEGGDRRQGRVHPGVQQPLHPADGGALHRAEHRQHGRRVHPQSHGGGACRRGGRGGPVVRQERVHRRLLRQLLPLGEHRRRGAADVRRPAPGEAVRTGAASSSRCPSSRSARTASSPWAPRWQSCAGRRPPRTPPTTR